MSTRSSFELLVSYSQIAVFLRDLENPFNEWTEQQVRQGFAWRPGSVSFRTLQEFGKSRVELIESSFCEFSQDKCVRAIEVPFELPRGKELELASISDSHVIPINPGTFQLRFEAFKDDVIRVSFLRNCQPRFKVLLADPELEVPLDFL